MRALPSLRATKSAGVLRRTQERLQLLRRVVVEAQIRGGKFFLQHSGIDEEAERSAFHAVGGTHQHFAFAFEVGAGHASIDRLGKGDGAVVEPDVYVLALDDRFANFEDPLRIESDIAQSVVKRQDGPRGQRNGLFLRRCADRAHGKQRAQEQTRSRDGPDCHEADLRMLRKAGTCHLWWD